MNNDVKIFYNNQDLFDGIAYTPFVSISQDFVDFGNKWNQVTNIALEGQITGQYVGPASFSSLTENFNTLLDRLKQNYKTLTIKENLNTIYNANIAIVDSINVENNNWYGLIPFTINFSIYDQELFTNHYGIVEPTEEISFSEQTETLNATHKISAKGILTQNVSPLNNAKNWVINRQNNFNINTFPSILVKRNEKPFIKTSEKEIIDRFNNVYSKEINYKKSLIGNDPIDSFLEYSVNVSSGENQFLTASINGNFKGNNINILEQGLNSINPYSICSQAANSFEAQLNSKPIEQFISKNSDKNILNFEYIYNNDFSSEIIHDYNVSISYDVLQCISTVNINGNIKCKYGDIPTRFEKCKNFYQNLNIYGLANTEYLKEINTPDGGLRAEPLSKSEKFNEFDGTINYSMQFNDKKAFTNTSIFSLESSIKYTPSVKIHVPNTSAFQAREHNIQNLNAAPRSKIQISVTAIVKPNSNVIIAENEAINEALRLRSLYVNNGLLENETIEKNELTKSCTVNQTLSFEGEIF